MSRFVPASRLAISLFGCMAVSSISVLCAQSPHARFDTENTPGGVRQLEAGQPEAVVHPTVEAMEKNRASHAGVFGSSTTSNLSYRGGKGGIGVETAPKIYLVLWGSQWASDPSGEEAIL